MKRAALREAAQRYDIELKLFGNKLLARSSAKANLAVRPPQNWRALHASSKIIVW